jgi:hypothetical protein
MDKELRKIQKKAAAHWADAHRDFERVILVLQWLDEQGFQPPSGLRLSIRVDYGNQVCLGFATGEAIAVYALNEEIQRVLRIVPKFDPDWPTLFICPRIWTRDENAIPVDINFRFDEKLLKEFVGDFCVIEKTQVSMPYSDERIKLTCFEV